jgi:hypothetical protein
MALIQKVRSAREFADWMTAFLDRAREREIETARAQSSGFARAHFDRARGLAEAKSYARKLASAIDELEPESELGFVVDAGWEGAARAFLTFGRVYQEHAGRLDAIAPALAREAALHERAGEKQAATLLFMAAKKFGIPS